MTQATFNVYRKWDDESQTGVLLSRGDTLATLPSVPGLREAAERILTTPAMVGITLFCGWHIELVRGS